MAGALVCGPTTAAAATRVTVAIVPGTTTVAELAQVPALSPGVMSAGIGAVLPEQTFLDISQGNRVGDALYDRDLVGVFPFAREVPEWADVVQRAESAPAEIVPGLLAETLRSGEISAYARQPMTTPAVIAANRRGVVSPLRGGACANPCLAIVDVSVAELAPLARRLRGDDLLIALAAPPADPDRALPIGIAGRGFEGQLTSDSTRTDGYVLSTDIAPTIVERFGLGTPDAMDGEPIRSEGSVDAAATTELADRMAAIPDRREPVLIGCLVASILIALAVKRIVFGEARMALAWLALCFAYLPLLLLAGAWLEPAAAAEGLLVGAGAAALAGVTVRFAWGWRGLALVCAVTLLAYAIDVVAGSGLTRLSLLGPNPIFGVRFYGIGNELEALFAVMVPAGVAAGLCAYIGWGRRVTPGGAAAAFLVAGAVGAVIFGAGRFGADVGAAIVLPVGAAVAAAAVKNDFEHFAPDEGENRSKPFLWRRLLVAAIGAAFIALLFLALLDLVSGSNSHLTRSVLDAGGAGDLADVVERRLRLSAHDFAQASGNPLFWIVVVGIGVALAQRRRIAIWLRPAPTARAGLIGASAAVAVGVLVNDSGATFLVLGSLALGAFLAYAWSQAGEIGSQAGEISSSPRNARGTRG